ncbi:TPA: hypothetical protein ACH3X2_007014 [Trebouxia sp. C0005]
MEQLSDQELSEIFAKIPFSQSKVSLQAVSVRWRRVVTMPESHSFSTFNEDQEITVADPMISPAVLTVLAGVKGSGKLIFKLPLTVARLQGLRLSCPPNMDCPTLPRLRVLEITQLGQRWGRPLWGFPSQLATAFPALHEFALGEHGCPPDLQCNHLLQALSQIRTLRIVRVYFDEAYILPEFSGHSDCELHLSVGYSSDMRKLPLSSAEHLVSLCCWMRDDIGISFLDWGHCTKLRSITVALEKCLPNCMAARPIYGLDKLPALETVNIYSIEESVCMPPVFLPPGWQAEMTEFTEPMSSAGLFSSGRNQLLSISKGTSS